jgi:hypothetical protein
MSDRKENIGNNIFNSILVLLFLLFMLSVSYNNNSSDINKIKHGLSCENTIGQSSAIIISTSLVINQKTWGSEKKYPEFINPVNNSFFENRKTNNQVSVQSGVVLNNFKIPVFIIHYHLSSQENDDIPFMS